MTKNFIRKKARKYNAFRIVAAVVFVTFIAVGALYGTEHYNNPALYGKWQSIETGDVVEFRKNGTVVVDETKDNPEYEILSPNRMQYTVNDKDFVMQYNLEGRVLKWGIEGQELEEFTRK